MADDTPGVDRERSTTPRERLVSIKATITFRVDEHNHASPLMEADRRAEALWVALHEIDPRASWAWSYTDLAVDRSRSTP